MIADPAERSQRGDWCIRQYGTRLSRGSEPVRFNCVEICCKIVVPMHQPYALALKLVYDASTVVTATNCTLWPDFDAEKDFQGKGDLCMAALPIAFPFGQGAFVPHSFDKFLNSIKAADGRPQILNSQPAPGLADALRALRQNKFHFFGSKNKYGMAEKTFQQKIPEICERTTCLHQYDGRGKECHGSV